MPQTPDTPTRPRPWTIPPAPSRRLNERLQATEILTEHEPGAAVFLWLLLRDLQVWSMTDTRSRAYVVRRPAALAHPQQTALDPVLDSIHDLLGLVTRASDDVAGAQDEMAAAQACTRIAGWATSAAPYTALSYALSAARLMPLSGREALAVARCAKRCGLAPFAEAWLRRAVTLSRRTRDWITYTAAFADAGELYLDRGDRTRARAAFVRGHRACRRYSVRGENLARIALGKFRIAAAEDDVTGRDRYQRLALRAGRANAPAIRRALAAALIDNDLHADAILLLFPASAAEEDPLDRLRTARLLGRAAHVAANGDVLANAWQLALDSIDEMPRADRTGLIREFGRDITSSSD